MSEFLAEARILVRPDTTRFRAELQTQLAAAVSQTPVTVPVTAAFAGSTGAITQFTAAQQEAAAATLGLANAQTVENQALARGAVLLEASAVATQQEAAAAEAAGAARTQNLAATRALTAQQNLAATASQKLALAQSGVAGAASEVATAQVILTRSTAAVAAAERALGAALEAKNIALIDAASQSVRLAQAQAAEAETALLAARAQATHAATLDAVNTAAIASGAGLLGLRGAVLTAGAAFIGATIAFQSLVKAIGAAANLETQLNVFKVTAGATADEMERASETAQDLGRDLTLPGVSAGQAAEALTELSKAGLSVQDSLDGAKGVLQLATAAQIDNVKSTQLVANALNSFSLAGEDAIRVADLLAGAAKESQGSIEDMGIGLRQVSGAAALLGLTVEDTVALLTQLTRAGLAGSDAGTTLRVALVRLARPDTRAEVEKLVGSLEDLQGNLDPRKIVELAEEIEKSGGKLDQTNKLYELFGENALRVIGLLASEGVAGFDTISASITESGLAAEAAGARMAGLQGDIENLKNQSEALGVTFGQVVIPPLSEYANLIADVVRRQTEVTQSNLETADSAKGLGQRFIEFATGSEEAGAALGDFTTKAVGLGARMQFLGPVTLAASLAIDRFGDSADDASGKTSVFDGILRRISTTLGQFGKAIRDTAPEGQPAEGLGVNQILNRIEGFDAAEVRARISGDTDALISVLESEQAFLESQLERQFVTNRPTLRRQIEQALLGVTNDLASISSSAAAEKRRVAQDVAQVQREADQVLLAALSDRREDAERRAAAAAQTQGLGDDIRAQDRIQALIKLQIQKVRDQIKDEQARKEAIRELRQALIDSQREEAALRQQRAQDRAAAQQEGAELDVEFAEITGNVAREIAARQRLIALLRKQQASVKKGTAEWKRLRNEIAEQQAAIKEARGQAEQGDDEGNRAAEFFFQQLQAQQGFAANLLGNLIPRDATAGLVGTPSPAVTFAGQIDAEAKAASGRATSGPTAGQASTTNAILLRIERLLANLNSSASAPEAVYQKKMGAAAMSGGGGNVDVM